MHHRNPNVPARHETRKPRKGAVVLATLATVGGLGVLAHDIVEQNRREAPITAYVPDSKYAQRHAEAYEEQFSPYTVGMESKHEAGKALNSIEALAQEYALDHGMSDTYAVQDEMTRQAVAFNREHNHQEDNPTYYLGQTFMLPNQPHQPEKP